MTARSGTRREPFDRRSLTCFMLRAHLLHGQRFGPGVISPPAWAMMLALYVCEGRRPVTTKALCLSSGAPIRTALRIIDGLVLRRLLVRSPDHVDRRQVNVQLAPQAIRLMNGYFDELVEVAGDPDGLRPGPIPRGCRSAGRARTGQRPDEA
jgi:DNA-binding MarR family transcriptional regulator